jgi:hypothetical protein
MNKQIYTYKQIIVDFCNETRQYKNQIDIPGLFLPHVLANYDRANKKYFYVGRDTNGWGSFNDLIIAYENNQIEEYIEKNNNWPGVVDNFLEYTNNKAGGFWTLASKLHLKLNGINETVSINTDIDEKYKVILSEMGYGNLNAIETHQSIKNRDKWNDIDQIIYWDIKSKSRRFDKLKYILDIYSPDYIFIFNWAVDEAEEELAFTDINVEWQENDHIPKILATYLVKDYNSKIIWTIHPRNLSFKEMNIDELIQEISSRI